MRTISYDDYLKAKGLLHLAQESRRETVKLEVALARLLGDHEDGGHTGDSIWNDLSVEELLDRLDIEVEGT